MAFDKPREAYEVQVVDEKGNTKAQCTLLPDDADVTLAFIDLHIM
ncbi:MAG: DUF4926 domain-containing protein [Lachnospiraceae bacterium]|nr:DUF4926 domain-containing protein [Lachnospiraceae bacterium]